MKTNILISHCHEDEISKECTIELASILLKNNIPCEIDYFGYLGNADKWLVGFEEILQKSRFVLLICNKSYHNKFVGADEKSKRSGVYQEAEIIRKDLPYNAYKYIPVIFKKGDEKYIPHEIGEKNKICFELKDEVKKFFNLMEYTIDIVDKPNDVVSQIMGLSKNFKYDNLKFETINNQGFEEYKYKIDGSIMIRIPSGTFIRGISINEKGSPASRPQKRISINEFFIDKNPVTNEMFDRFIKNSLHELVTDVQIIVYDEKLKCWKKEKGHTWKHYYNEDTAKSPVVFVTWEDAKAYADWAKKRLPSEAEWEMAAKGPYLDTEGNQNKRKYPWGNDEPNEELANYGLNKGTTTHIEKYIGGASYYGCLDMAGNVWEWCNDYYDIAYYMYSPDENPKGPIDGNRRINRGGSWLDDEDCLICTHRDGDDSLRYSHVGFRCVLSFDDE